MEDDKVSLKSYIYDMINNYDEETAEQLELYNLDDEDINNIIVEVLSLIGDTVREELEDYAFFKTYRNGGK